jgi:hypothetical protein
MSCPASPAYACLVMLRQHMRVMTGLLRSAAYACHVCFTSICMSYHASPAYSWHVRPASPAYACHVCFTSICMSCHAFPAYSCHVQPASPACACHVCFTSIFMSFHASPASICMACPVYAYNVVIYQHIHVIGASMDVPLRTVTTSYRFQAYRLPRVVLLKNWNSDNHVSDVSCGLCKISGVLSSCSASPSMHSL